ncbi:MAG: DUF2330 domain-containing protein [Planctomycetota bacterium]|jgi:hypothetical protein
MFNRTNALISCGLLVAIMTLAWPVNRASACGGFFCQVLPMDQAGEQIIFRKDGNMVTAVVLIQYEGDAPDFSWVVPVPGIPDLSVGSELVFNPLEQATRPVFTLLTEGSQCESPDLFSFGANSAADGGALDDGAGGDGDDGVEILQEQAVGPFDTVVVASDDPEALATWLEENDYDLTDRGAELITPYVEEGMNFVALRLRQDQGVGDLQPLVMRYESEGIMIPIRLTAVAAMPDMGILVWLLGESRGVPLNYLHVVPNYTRLNWYSGTFNAYVSYQGLITAAMDEAGGQGFATDFAGSDFDAASTLPMSEDFEQQLGAYESIEDDAEFLATMVNEFPFVFFNVQSNILQDKVLEVYRRELPLGEGEDEFAYFQDDLLRTFFSEEELDNARTTVLAAIQESILAPLDETNALFDGDPYMTRVYTTLSPEEMTLDPTFSFNPDLDDQPLERQATINLECTLAGTRWSLTLGSGTDRDGETVIEGTGVPPGFFSPQPVIDQDSLFRSEEVTTSGAPTVVEEKQFPTAQVIGEDDSGGGLLDPGSMCGALTGSGCGGGAAMIFFTMLGLQLIRRRR